MVIGAIRNLFGRKSRPVQADNRRERLALHSKTTPTIYAIGDVHGCYDQLIDAQRRILADAAKHKPGRRLIVMLGDYVDRGPRSADVIEHLALPPPEGFLRISLCGNHDDSFLKFIANPMENMEWLEFGGDTTLESYGIDVVRLLRHNMGLRSLAGLVSEAVPAHHVALLKRLPVAVSLGDYIFAHAGIRPGLPVDNQSEEDLMWIREPFLSQGSGLPQTVVHGHTAAKEPVFGKNRICIDTGAYATGRLTVLKVHGEERQILD
ncbi:metallophosphoesterase family protein [Oryzibacter oryziterrae]|uniref:metallophosphoesterase family protein n=1 Tax=Oryzibacter oryziterrae TaxID=2766474 RepID=UPI001F3842DE|nr:metallophosphoesterase family protein [Oryzibacter oryziterrae]